MFILRYFFLAEGDRMDREELAIRFKNFAVRECKGSSGLYEYLSHRIAEDDVLLDIAAAARTGQPVPNQFFTTIERGAVCLRARVGQIPRRLSFVTTICGTSISSISILSLTAKSITRRWPSRTVTAAGSSGSYNGRESDSCPSSM